MPENPNYPNYPPYQQPALEADELDEATLDRVVGGLESPQALQETQYPGLQNGTQDVTRSYATLSNLMRGKHNSAKNAINNIR
jgi:hypothetical protein